MLSLRDKFTSRNFSLLDLVLAVVFSASLIVALSFFAVHNLDDFNIWFDESGQYWLSRGLNHDSPISALPGNFLDGIFFGRNGFNLDPPGFTVLLALWVDLFGSSIEVLRLLPFTFYVLAFPIGFFIARRVLGLPRIIAVSVPATLLASGLSMQYATELRAYSAELLLVLTLSLVTFLCLQNASNFRKTSLFAIMLIGICFTRYAFLVSEFAAVLTFIIVFTVRKSWNTQWKTFLWPCAGLFGSIIIAAWSVGVFGGGYQFGLGKNYSSSMQIHSMQSVSEIFSLFQRNLAQNQYLIIGVFLLAGVTYCAFGLLRNQRLHLGQKTWFAIFSFACAYLIISVALSTLGFLPWAAGHRWSIGWEVVVLLSALGLLEITRIYCNYFCSRTSTNIRNRTLAVFTAVSCVLLMTFTVIQLATYRHVPFRFQAARLPAMASQFIPKDAEVHWIVDYWSWPTFRWLLTQSGSFPSDIPVDSAVPAGDGVNTNVPWKEAVSTRPLCLPGVWTAVVHENWGDGFDELDNEFISWSAAQGCVVDRYDISDGERLLTVHRADETPYRL